MTPDRKNAPGGDGTGGAQDEQPGGRVVMPSVRRYPVAWARLYAPAGRRTRWWAAINCPHCGGVHLARLRARSDLPSVRRSGCGPLVWVVPS